MESPFRDIGWRFHFLRLTLLIQCCDIAMAGTVHRLGASRVPVKVWQEKQSMSLQVAQDGLFAKLFWIWISLLISVFVFWRLRHLWLKLHPPLDVRTKYSRRLTKRLRDRQALRLKCRTPRKPRPRHRR